MKALARGRLRGDTLILETPVPPLEGRVLRVTLEPLDEEEASGFPAEELAHQWEQWILSGPQGPIDAEENDPGFP